MIGEIVVNGKSSKDFNVYVSDAGLYGTPERDTESIEVEGRNGDLIIDKGRYKNKEVIFPCLIMQNFSLNFSEFVGYLLSQDGYARIETSFLPNEFIMGKYIGEIDAKPSVFSQEGSFQIKFSRKPQRYQKDGEQAIEYTANSGIYNPYHGIALPLVRVYGTGTLTIGTTTIIVNSLDEYVDIDCELQDAYKGAINCNGDIILSSNRFFELKPGNNSIQKTAGISKVVITPRWWKL